MKKILKDNKMLLNKKNAHCSLTAMGVFTISNVTITFSAIHTL
ncbi:hypothetical protein JCM19233_2182 [Vibrio astriarenae]|nr:hypothetical protein JCM19233_2182 [Vibrio sp. C7]